MLKTAGIAPTAKLFGWEPLLPARAARRKLKVVDIPGDETAGIGGERKLRPRRWGAAFYLIFWR